jgi:hypothetical protein
MKARTPETGTAAAPATFDRKAVGVSLAIAIVAGVFGAAFLFAPRACEGGLDLYFWSGVAALIMLAILPFVLRLGGSFLGSIGWAFGLLLLGAATWIGALVAANFQILCRLF